MDEGGEAPQASQPEVSQTDAAKSAFPAARSEAQPEQGFRPKPDIDELADRVSKATPEELPRALMEFYEEKAARLRRDIEKYKAIPDTPEARASLDKWEGVSAKIREQLGEPKLEVTQSDATKASNPAIRQTNG